MYPYSGLAYPAPYPVNYPASYPTYPVAMPAPMPYGSPWDAPGYYPSYPPVMTQYAPPSPAPVYTQPEPSLAPLPNTQTPATSDVTPGSPSFSEVKASHILVKTREEAERIRKEIISGKKRFEEAAKVSKCPSGKKGGDLGFFAKGDMVPEFDKVVFKLPIGVISEPVKTEFGWHLIRVTEHR